MTRHLILGAGGPAGTNLARTLIAKGDEVTTFARRGGALSGAKSLAGDVLDATAVRSAMAGMNVAYVMVGLPYSAAVWQRDWPRAMANCLDAAETTGGRLVFLDNVYAYGAVSGPMTEDTPLNPVSKKGMVRQAIAEAMMARMAARRIKGMIVRAADFYGPGTERTGMAALTIFNRLAEGRSPQALCCHDKPHSFTFLPDIGPAIARLVATEAAWGQVWHLPTAQPPLTCFEMAAKAADMMGREEGINRLPAWLIKTLGIFAPALRETGEMLYQNNRPYIFSSARIEKELGLHPTTYEEGIRQTVASYGRLQEPAYATTV